MKFRFRNPQKALNKKLIRACQQGSAKDAGKLLEQGAEMNCRLSGGPPLFAAAYGGDSDSHLQCVELLLARGAEVDIRNSVNCTPLMGAANRGHLKAAKALLAAGADPELQGRGRNSIDWSLTSGNPDVIALFRTPKPEPRVEAPHEVLFRRPFGNRVLEEVFDFSACERITLVRKGEDGPVEAITRDGFSTLEDRARLREAFEAYARKGGHPDADALFPEALPKPKLNRQP